MSEIPEINQSSTKEEQLSNEPKFCINCGRPLGPGVRFCTNCGTKVEALPEQDLRQPVTENKPLSVEIKGDKTENDLAADMGFDMERLIQENNFSPEMVDQLLDLYKSTEKSVVETKARLQTLEEKGIDASDSLAQRMNLFLLKMNERKVVLERVVDKARDAGLINAQSEEDIQSVSRIFPRDSLSSRTGRM